MTELNAPASSTGGRHESPLDGVPPQALLGGTGDEVWRWLNLDGREVCPFLAAYLPAVPPEPEQVRVNAIGGREALELGFQIYSLFMQLYEEERGPLAGDDRVLDFGCGWGRVIRYFLKDVAPENLVGMDIDERAIEVCRETNRWCRFEHSSVLPPSGLERDSFDLIYAYSVFSHLSEEAHLRWLEEFARLLKPNGVLLLTTLGRGFVERMASGSAETTDQLSGYKHAAARIFAGSDGLLEAYDRGEYCYGAIDPAANPHFGFSAVPERYARLRWAQHVTVGKWIEKPAPDLQTIIVCTRPAVEEAAA